MMIVAQYDGETSSASSFAALSINSTDFEIFTLHVCAIASANLFMKVAFPNEKTASNILHFAYVFCNLTPTPVKVLPAKKMLALKTPATNLFVEWLALHKPFTPKASLITAMTASRSALRRPLTVD